MARTSVGIVLACCVVAVGLGGHAASGRGDNPDQRQRNLLAVNVALDQGLTLLQRGDFAAAVAVLDKHLAHIDGNRAYLAALRDAYRGHVGLLERDGHLAEAKRIRSFLEILEPVRVARPTAPAPGQPAATRAKVEQDVGDPFAEANRDGEQPAQLVAQAEKAFQQKNFEEAGRLYARAAKADPGATAESKERWGYCRLFGVAQRLRRGDAGDQVEGEIRDAGRLSPRLEGFARSLLEKARQPAGVVAVAVKHTGKSGTWSVAETDNFRIFHSGDEQTAEKVARIAEATRVNMTRKWFNEEPAAWTPRCDIFLHATGATYASETGAPAAAPGHSTISLDAGRVVKRRVDVRLDDANALVGVLPHEMTHVVLGGRFGTSHVPRWADEGVAVLSEPRARVELHLRNLPKHRRDGTLFGVGELMKQDEYPEGRRVGAFYAQSVSVVEFLCKKKDPLTFTRFLRLGLTAGYEVALERYYGYRSFAEMQKDWDAGTHGVVTVSGK